MTSSDLDVTGSRSTSWRWAEGVNKADSDFFGCLISKMQFNLRGKGVGTVLVICRIVKEIDLQTVLPFSIGGDIFSHLRD